MLRFSPISALHMSNFVVMYIRELDINLQIQFTVRDYFNMDRVHDTQGS
jgi:hypothetical protein